MIELPEIQILLQNKQSPLVGNTCQQGGPAGYTISLALTCVAFLKSYHSSLIIDQDTACAVFERLLYVNIVIGAMFLILSILPYTAPFVNFSLLNLTKHINNPGECLSAERCIFAYSYDLFRHCAYIKVTYQHILYFCTSIIHLH